jgi:outer membrane biosynthesis protein TonB
VSNSWKVCIYLRLSDSHPMRSSLKNARLDPIPPLCPGYPVFRVSTFQEATPFQPEAPAKKAATPKKKRKAPPPDPHIVKKPTMERNDEPLRASQKASPEQCKPKATTAERVAATQASATHPTQAERTLDSLRKAAIRRQASNRGFYIMMCIWLTQHAAGIAHAAAGRTREASDGSSCSVTSTMGCKDAARSTP